MGRPELSAQTEALRYLSRTFLSIQRARMAAEKRLTFLLVKKADPWVLNLLRSTINGFKNYEKEIKREVMKRLEGTELLDWVERVKGLGETAALLFAGEINERVSSAGKVWAYWGLTPLSKKRAGQKVVGNPSLKGKALYITRSLIAGRKTKAGYYPPDPYYYGYFEAKRHYYTHVKNLNPLVAHYKAVFWLAKLLLSHAYELKRLDAGLDVSAVRSHRNYIPPKPTKDALPDDRLLEKIKLGQV